MPSLSLATRARAFLTLTAVVLTASCISGLTAPKVTPRGTLQPEGAIDDREESKPFQVVFASPQGETSHDVEISIAFNRPLRALTSNDVPPPAFTMSPAVRGTWDWVGSRALRFSPEKPLPRATAFVITLSAETRALDGSTLGKPYELRFSTKRPELVSTSPNKGAHDLLPSATIDLRFNQPVTDAELLRTAKLTAAGKPIDVTIRRNDPTDQASAVLVPRTPLPTNSEIALSVDATLHGTDGDLTAGHTKTMDWRTYGPFTVSSIGCSPDPKRCRTGGDLEIVTSTPVKIADLRKAVSIDPPVKLRWPSWQTPDEQSSWLSVEGDFRAGQSYTLTFRGAGTLKDQHGQTLRADAKQRFTFDDLSPRVQLGVSGTYLEPTALRAVPLFATNVQNADVTLAPLTSDEIIELLARPDRGTELTELEIAALPGSKKHSLSLAAPKNRLGKSSIALDGVLGKSGRGVVAVDVSYSAGADRALLDEVLQVTDLAITAKLSSSDSVVWVTHLSTGQPVEGATVQVLAQGAVGPPALFRTDAQGIALLPAGTVPLDDEVRRRAIVVAREGDDWSYRRVNDVEDLWRFGASSACDDASCDRSLGLMFTERSLYRPGDEVQMKGIVRIPEGKGLRTPRGSHVTVTLHGPEGEKLATMDETLSPFGSFATKAKLPASAKVGRYRISAQLGDPAHTESDFGTSLEVAEYRPAEFKVAVDLDKATYMRGDAVHCKTRGDYLFGAPMTKSGASVALTRTSTYFTPPGTEQFRDDDETYASAHADGSPRAGEIATAKGTLDDKGAFTFDAKLDLAGQHGAERVVCESEVTDLSRQSLSSESSAIVHPGEFYVGLRVGDESFVAEGTTLHPTVIAATPTGKRMSGVTVRLELYRREWAIARQAGTRNGYHTDVTITDAGKGGCTVATGEKPVGCDLSVATAGFYVVRATSADSRGNKLAASDSFYSIADGGTQSFGWGDNDEGRVSLVANKKSYAPGETARILIKSPFTAAEALVTVEREGVISQKRISVHGPTPTVDIPITDADLPNAFVSVLLVRGRTKVAPTKDDGTDIGAPTFRLGFVELPISIDSRKLRVAVKPRATDLHPGDTAEIDVDVKDAAGKGARAEVTLYAVDEGTLSLAGYKTPDPVALFFAPRPLRVTTSDSRRDLAHIQKDAGGILSGLDKGFDGGGGGDATRRDFRQTVYFEPSLITSEDGRAHASFKLPDSLSTFRVMAVVAATDDRFGSADALITSSKPLMVRAALPRILRAGDRLEASAIVTSKGLARSSIEVAMTTEGLESSGDTKRVIDLEPGRSAEVRFPLSASKAGSAKIRFAAKGGGATDAVEVTREVKSPTMLEATAVYGDTTSATGEALGDLSQIRDDVGALELSLSATALTGLAGGVEQLVEYPYGCTEQLTSRLVPLLPLRDLAKLYGLKLPADVDAAVNATLAKVTANQHQDGGFGLWPESTDSSAWLTAYALWGLGDAQRRGLSVRPQTLENGIRYLRRKLTEHATTPLDRAQATFIVDVLAENGQPDAGAMQELFEHRAEMPAFAQAQLLHAMALGKMAPASLEQLSRDVSQTIHFDGPIARASADFTFDSMLDSSTRTAALVLRALVAADPKHPMAGKLAMGILAARKQGTWRTTQETAWALLALDDYRRAVESTEPSFDARVFMGQALLAEVPFRDRSVLAVSREVKTTDLVHAGGDVLAFQVKGEGHLFYEARLRFARKEMPKDAVEHGFFVERSQRVVTPETLQTAIGEAAHGTVTKLTAGDLVLVDLTVVTPSERSFVVLDDPLPAGLEALDSTLDHSASWSNLGRFSASSEDDDDRSWYWRSPITRHETRDDRVLFFVDALPAGVHHYRYLARATSIGAFAAPPARVEEMYTPETFGHTASAHLEITP